MAKQPHLLVERGEIHPTVLTPGDPDRVDRIASHCDRSSVMAENREYRLVNATHDGVDLTICSTGIGAPSAAIAVEELVAVGAERLIRVGTCGGLQPNLEIGDMIVATGAGKDEGTTKRYESATIPAVADHETVTALVNAAAAEGAVIHTGPIVTDDAYYAETEAYVTEWSSAGLLAVEMEAAAIFTLARRHGLLAGAICTVDGNLIAGEQKGETDEEELPERAKERVGRAIEIALDAAVLLDEEYPDTDR